MKTRFTSLNHSCRFASLVVLAGAMTAGLSAADRTSQSSANKNTTQSQTASQSGSDQPGKLVKVTRASNYLGTDVTASDGRKVGDIVDYVFDASQQPHLQYVVVMTGGFMGYGGDARAVPPSAISMEGDAARLDISSEDYWNAPVLPQNRTRFLNNPSNRDQLAKTFNVSDQRSQSAGQSDRKGKSQSDATLVTFTELTNSDVFDRDRNRIGRFEDTWLSLDSNRAPYAEITVGPASPFETLPRYRYAVPMTQLQASSDLQGVQFNITEEEIRQSDMVNETDGVQMLQSGDIGRQILRVRVAQQ